VSTFLQVGPLSALLFAQIVRSRVTTHKVPSSVLYQPKYLKILLAKRGYFWAISRLFLALNPKMNNIEKKGAKWKILKNTEIALNGSSFPM